MAYPEHSLAIRTYGGGWEEIGQGAPSRGVWAEGLRWSSEVFGGSKDLSCTLKRDTRKPWPDFAPLAPVVGFLGTQPRWSGRLMSNPTSRGEGSSFNLQADGWISHLSDQPIDKRWVHADLTEWRDARSIPTTTLGSWHAAATVEVGDGGVLLSLPKGGTVQQNKGIGITLDLGPNNTAKRVVATWESSNNWGANATLYCDRHTSENLFDGTAARFWSQNAPGAGPTTSAGTATTASRYVTIYLFWASTDVTSAADVWVRITSIKVFTDAADESGNASILTANTIISETLTACAPLLSTDHSGLAPSSFAFPHFPAQLGYTPGREHIQNANAAHLRQFFLAPDPVPRPIWRDVPTAPSWIVSQREGYHSEDQGRDDASEVFSRVRVQFVDATGKPDEVTATASNTWAQKWGADRDRIVKMTSASNSATATQIATAYAAVAQYAPMKGTLNVRGHIRNAYGIPVPVGYVNIGDAILIEDIYNPNTGLRGRIGIISNIEYSADGLELRLQIDSPRDFIEGLLARMGALLFWR